MPNSTEQHQTTDDEARMTFGAFLEMIFIVITSNQGVKLYVPSEESLQIPLKYIDVVRQTNTTLDIMLESRTDDYWNVDGDREL